MSRKQATRTTFTIDPDRWEYFARRFKLTIGDVAKLLHLSRGTFSSWVGGKRELGQGNVEAIADAMKRAAQAVDLSAVIDWRELVGEHRTETVAPKFPQSKGVQGTLLSFGDAFRKALDQVGHESLYCSLTDGHWLWENLPRDISGSWRRDGGEVTTAPLRRIVVRRMRMPVHELMENGPVSVFTDRWSEHLDASLVRLAKLYGVSKSGKVHKIDIEVVEWPLLAPIWGFLFGETLIYGKWGPDDFGRYRAHDAAWLVTKTGPAADEFEHYSHLLIHGTPIVQVLDLPASQLVVASPKTGEPLSERD